MLSLRQKYFFMTMLLLSIEIAIAWFFNDYYIRGFVGDVLVIPLLYYVTQLVVNNTFKFLKVLILLFAFCVEFIQLFHLPEQLNIHSPIIRTIIGTSFDYWDLIAYCLGYVVIKQKRLPV